MADGQAPPPFIENAVVWRVARGLLDGKTPWRKIFPDHARELPPAPRGILGGMRKDKHHD
jgi:hypothetical protein